MTGKTDSEKDNSDYLGYSVYAETLWNRIEAALNKDQGDPARLGDDPLVVGIFGEWGAGKSTLLKLVERQAEAAARRAAETNSKVLTVPVYFQPWKYEHEKHLLVPLVLHVVEATRQALKTSPTVRQQLAVLSKEAQVATWKWGKKAHETAKTARKWFPVLKKVVGSLSVFGFSIALPDEIDDWLADAETVFASPEAKEAQRAASAQEARNKKLSFVDNGIHYYELHELLKSLTRPGNGEHTRDLANTQPEADRLRLNFVLLIDDLDRCLPEKAVETLELIKTVFNLESFAFVLALDEEVVERGIGHRYKDYALQNKKPEMPITGFEYLEKIVHLPFRLPGLTRDQARRFMQRYEREKVAPDRPERWWFAPRPAPDSDSKATLARGATSKRPRVGADLIDLVLRGFTAWVPRKLVRLIELFHQIQDLASRQGKSLSWGATDGTDVRVVAALLMIQLFQPDLYRLVRRNPLAFPLLLGAFATRDSERKDFSDPWLSDMDLWLWVAEESVGEGNDWVHTADIPKATDAAIARIARRFHGQTQRASVNTVAARKIGMAGDETVASDPIRTSQYRFRAQNVKLPLVVQLLEHRAAQRHAFDSLQLLHSLAAALEHDWDVKKGVSPALNLTISNYFELLVVKGIEDASQTVSLAASGSVGMVYSATGSVAVSVSDMASRGTQPVRYPDRLFADITSDLPEVQANLVANNELEAGKYLEMGAAQHLLEQLKGWLDSLEGSDRPEGQRRLTRCLKDMAPLIPREQGRAFLSLVDDPDSVPFHVHGRPLAFNSVEDAQRELDRADLWSALGLDDRFDAKRFHLPKSRLPENVNESEREPIPGFVRVFEADQECFQTFAGLSVILKPYYMARYLTTVDQYARFVEAGGYGDPGGKNPDWWDTLGWQWRTGVWDSRVRAQAYREHLDRRKPVLRGAPVDWVEQQAHGSRPVTRLNWFEARAYANWLTIQLRAELDAALRQPGYAVRLPTEAQWERAARAKNRTQADERQYPWGGTDEKTSHIHVSIGPDDNVRPRPVGLFEPNPLGLCDLSGNVVEWQNNLYQLGSQGQDMGLNTDVTTLKTHEAFDQCDRPALRGGSWIYSMSRGIASSRSASKPIQWDPLLGFRVVLSLAEQNPET